jgi:predicted component of type VI protein secretion system
MRKRNTLVLCIVTMLFATFVLLLAGCGPQNPEPQASPTASPEASPEASPGVSPGAQAAPQTIVWGLLL